MNKTKWFIESDLIPRTEIKPVTKGIFEYKKEKGKIYFRLEIKDKLKFATALSYELVSRHNVDECSKINVFCERPCNGTYYEFWTGVFTYFSCEVHLDRCYIEAEVDPNDSYQCWTEVEEDEVNIFSGTGGPISVASTFSGNGSGRYVTQTCFDFGTSNEGDDQGDPPSSCLADPDNWCLKSEDYSENCQEDPNTPQNNICEYEHEAVWHREEFDTNCVDGQPVPPSFGSGWQILTDDCAGAGVVTWWRCPPTSTGNQGQTVILGPYDYGRALGDVVQKILDQADCPLELKSDFFNILPAGDAPDNIAYQYAAANLRNVTVHQISDVKSPRATNPSSSNAWIVKGRDFFEDLRKIYNVWFDIIDGQFILEHFSYFTSGIGLDLTAKPMEMLLEYGGSDHPQYERNQYATEQSFTFKAQAIKYDCGSGDEENKAALFSADLGFIESDANDETVDAEGFVLIANNVIDNEHIIIDNNAPHQWNNLLANLHLHGKAFKSGQMNGAPVNFLSWKPYIKQKEFDTVLCCGDDFNPNNKQITRFGEGVVEGAEINAITGRLSLELMY